MTGLAPFWMTWASRTWKGGRMLETRVSKIAAVHAEVVDGDDLVAGGAGAGGRAQGVGILRLGTLGHGTDGVGVHSPHPARSGWWS